MSKIKLVLFFIEGFMTCAIIKQLILMFSVYHAFDMIRGADIFITLLLVFQAIGMYALYRVVKYYNPDLDQ